MKDKPQLTAEMEKRFDELFKYSLWSDADSLGVDMSNKVKHFLATALEEQKRSYAVKIYREIVDLRTVRGAEKNHLDSFNAGLNRARDILNGKE